MGRLIIEPSAIESTGRFIAIYHCRFEQTTGELFDCRLNVGCLPTQPYQSLFDLWVEIPFEQRQQRMSNAIPCESLLVVAGICAIILINTVEIVFNISPCGREQRADEVDGLFQRTCCWNARQAGDSRTAQYVMQNRFRLVVGRVCDGNVSAIFAVSCLGQEFIAQLACGLFQAAPLLTRDRSHVAAFENQPNVECRTQGRNPCRVVVRLAATQLVIQMSGGDFELMLVPQVVQSAQQRDTIGTAGDSDQQAGTNQLAIDDAGGKGFAK